jgi:aldose 1-epimerase
MTSRYAVGKVDESRSAAMADPSLAQRTFGHLPSGEPVETWTLRGAGGLVVEIITYGAIVTRLTTLDKNSHRADVVLGFNDLESYLTDRAYIGAVVGRVAGRITGGRFELDGERFELTRNEPPNHLHGGRAGFNTKLWRAYAQDHPNGAPSLRMACSSPHGEEGYAGTVDVALTFTVRHDNVLLVETEATTDRPTPVSLTFHHYFNLAGEGAGSIADHELQVHSGEYVPTDEQLTLLGRVESVAGRGNDFRRPKNLAQALPLLVPGHGDLYRLSRSSREEPQLKAAARLVHPSTGRALQVSTTANYLQLYFGTLLDGSAAGKSGVAYGPYAGVCLECEGYPDAANCPQMGDIILRPGSPRRETTAYAFQLVQ